MNNYFEDCYEKEKLTLNDLKNSTYINDINIKKRKFIINKKTYKYRDPDSNSIKLYTDLKDLYETKFNELGIDICVKKYKIKLSNGLVLSSDYIGPSTTCAFHVGYDNKLALENILDGRVIGGHILWPIIGYNRKTNFFTINCKKALSGWKQKNGVIGISDRMDICLHEIKRYLDKDYKNEKCYNENLSNLLEGNIPNLKEKEIKIIKEKNDTFFKMFDNDFKKFCDFFDLVGSFVKEDYSINFFLKEKDKELITVDMYKKYAKNNINAIKDRTKIILNEGNKI